MKKMKLEEHELLQFAIEVDYKAKKGVPVMTASEISDNPKFKNDMLFEMRLPNGNVERKYITRKRLKNLDVIKFVVRKMDIDYHRTNNN